MHVVCGKCITMWFIESNPMSVSRVETTSPAPESGVETIIQSNKGWIGVDWAELWSHRELLYFLVWRDVKVKYKQAIFGSAWAIVVPLVSVLIYSLIGQFAGFANRLEAGTPYPAYIYAGLLPWLFLQTAINGGGLSLVNNQALLTKIYMPRLFIPSATIGSALVDMFMSMLVFTGMMVFYTAKTQGAWTPSWQIVFLPLFVLLLMIAALGVSYLLSALTIMYRDLRFIIPFITQLGIWLTAVVYPQRIFMKIAEDGTVLADYRPWLALNPAAGIVSGWRSCILGTEWQWTQVISSAIVCPLMLLLGIFYFKRVERRFADIA